MKITAKINKLMLELEKITPCYILVYKTEKGKYKVAYLHNKEEKQEIKSILMSKCQ